MCVQFGSPASRNLDKKLDFFSPSESEAREKMPAALQFFVSMEYGWGIWGPYFNILIYPKPYSIYLRGTIGFDSLPVSSRGIAQNQVLAGTGLNTNHVVDGCCLLLLLQVVCLYRCFRKT